jgi:hypothetical protein
MNRTLTLDYSLWRDGGKKTSVAERFSEELAQVAIAHIVGAIAKGFVEGEILTEIRDGKKPIPFRGWWKITNQEV